MIALDVGAEPIPGDQPRFEDLAARLSTLTVETWTPTLSRNYQLERRLMAPEGAKALLKSLFRVLPGDIVVELVESALAKGRPYPYVVDYHGSREAPPSAHEGSG